MERRRTEINIDDNGMTVKINGRDITADSQGYVLDENNKRMKTLYLTEILMVNGKKIFEEVHKEKYVHLDDFILADGRKLKLRNILRLPKQKESDPEISDAAEVSTVDTIPVKSTTYKEQKKCFDRILDRSRKHLGKYLG